MPSPKITSIETRAIDFGGDKHPFTTTAADAAARGYVGMKCSVNVTQPEGW